MDLVSPFFCDESTPLGRLIAGSLREQNTHRTEFVSRVRNVPLSMLSDPTLRAVHRLSEHCAGTIIEIGAYVGGATLCILEASASSDTHFVTIEEEVEHPTHPTPTNNTVADHRKNIEAFDLARPSLNILAGASFETWVLGELQHLMLGRRAELLVWDADAAFDRDLIYLAPYLADDCVLVVDDYMSQEGKSSRITRTINEWVASGILETSAVLPWATWFGRLLRKPTLAEIKKAQASWRTEALAGDPYCKRLIDYQARLAGVGDVQKIPMSERMDFWRSAQLHAAATKNG